MLDLVGGDLPARSWQVLAPQGALVSIAALNLGAITPANRRAYFHSMQADPAQLQQIAQAVATK